jgi:hypothetical protein
MLNMDSNREVGISHPEFVKIENNKEICPIVITKNSNYFLKIVFLCLELYWAVRVNNLKWFKRKVV